MSDYEGKGSSGTYMVSDVEMEEDYLSRQLKASSCPLQQRMGLIRSIAIPYARKKRQERRELALRSYNNFIEKIGSGEWELVHHEFPEESKGLEKVVNE